MREIRLEEIDSTNSYAKLNLDNLADKTVIHAKSQTAGRGRLNRSWVDFGDGNLFMSIVLKPSDSYINVFSNLTQYLSVCLCKVLENYGLVPQIKWPNDVLINGKKIAGILSESVIQSGGICRGIVLGLGVNLNATVNAVEAIIEKPVTALNLETNKIVNVDVFRNELLEKFFLGYENFMNTGFEFIKSDYVNRCCFIGKELSVQVFDKIYKGLAKAVNDNGELVLLENDNELILTIGDIL